MEDILNEEAKQLIQQMRNSILDYDFNMNFSKNIMELYLKIGKKLKQDTDDPEQEVLNMFFVNIYNSFESLLILIERKKLADSYVIARRIVEIYIRNEYLYKNNRYSDYYRMQYFEKAMLLRTLIKSHRTKNIINNPLWKERDIIVNENKKLYEEINIHKTTPHMATSLEEMARDTSLAYLYHNTYATWSKMVHCNMSSENTVRYKINDKFCYDFPENNLMDYKKDSIRNIIACVNQMMYKFICRFSEKRNISRNLLDKFRKNNILTSYDFYTGKDSTINEFASTIMKNSYGVHVSFEEIDEVKLFETDANVFKRNNEELQKLVRETEEKLSKKE